MSAVLRRPLWRVVERNAVVARRRWYLHATSGVEPFLYLLSVGVGVGALVDAVPGPAGDPVAYRDFVAPAMLAGAAMNSAVFDSVFNFFIRFKYLQTYDAMLATPLTPRDLVRGELAWTLARVTYYGAIFVVTIAAMGIVATPWAVLALPAAVLVTFAFGSVGMAASTWLRSWLDFEFVLIATMPLFLFSATFFPLERYPRGLQLLVQCSPLYHGADLLRRLVLGGVGWGQLGSVAYLAVVGLVGLGIAERRVTGQLQP